MFLTAKKISNRASHPRPVLRTVLLLWLMATGATASARIQATGRTPGPVIPPDSELWKPPCAAIPNGLIAWYRFERTYGDLFTEDSAGSHDARIFGAQLTAGTVNQGALFDGIDDSLVAPAHPCLDLGAGPFAVDAWVGQGATGPIVSKYPANISVGWEFGITPGRQLYFTGVDQAQSFWVVSTGVLPAFGDALAAISVSTGDQTITIQFSINGFDAGSFGPMATAGGFASMSSLTLGASWLGGYYAGTLDEVEIFNQAVSLQDFQTIAASGFVGKCSPCSLLAQPWVTSTFTSGNEGWNVVQPNGNETPVWVASGGSPGAFIQRLDAEAGGYIFQAPAAFLGNRSIAQGVWFDWRADQIDATGRFVGISLYNGILRLSKSCPVNDQYVNTWLRYDFAFLPGVDWTYDDGINPPRTATQADIQAVLVNVTDIRISGESRVGISETTRLDNPTLYVCQGFGIPTGNTSGTISVGGGGNGPAFRVIR